MLYDWNLHWNQFFQIQPVITPKLDSYFYANLPYIKFNMFSLQGLTNDKSLSRNDRYLERCSFDLSGCDCPSVPRAPQFSLVSGRHPHYCSVCCVPLPETPGLCLPTDCLWPRLPQRRSSRQGQQLYPSTPWGNIKILFLPQFRFQTSSRITYVEFRDATFPSLNGILYFYALEKIKKELFIIIWLVNCTPNSKPHGHLPTFRLRPKAFHWDRY